LVVDIYLGAHMTSLLNVAKIAADIVLGLKSYKKYRTALTKAHKQVFEAENAIKEVKFNLESLTHTFNSSTGKGGKANDALKMVREAMALLNQADAKLVAANETMNEVDWEK
jgi:exonuclease VII small subunit